MNQILTDSTVPGPPEPAAKRPNGQFGTPLCDLSPSSEIGHVDSSETLTDGEEDTGKLLSPPPLPELSNPPAKEELPVPVALRPHSELAYQHFSV